MLKTVDCIQGSEQWQAVRRPRLNSSECSIVFSSRDYKVASLVREATEEEIDVMSKRAKRQLEVLNILNESEKEASELNASGLKGLAEKGIACIREIKDSCSIKPSAARTHIDLLIARGLKDEDGSFIFPDPDVGINPPLRAMERGHELEPLARVEFEALTGLTVKEVGYCYNNEISTMFGASTDGLVSNGTGVLEIKCPYPKTHIGYLRKGVLPSEYKEQVHAEMAATGATHGYFLSYCPKLPSLLLKINRNEYTESLTKCVKQFTEMYQYQLNELKENTQ